MTLRKILKYISFFMIGGILMSETVFAVTGTVTGNEVNIRKGPSKNTLEVSVAEKGEKVEILDEEGDWYYIKFEDVNGYINKNYVTLNGEISSNNEKNNSEKDNNQEPKEPEQSEENNQNQIKEQDNTNSEETVEQVENNETNTEQINNYEQGQIITIVKDTNLKYLPNFTSRNNIEVKVGETFTVELVLNNWVKISNNTNFGWILKNNIK